MLGITKYKKDLVDKALSWQIEAPARYESGIDSRKRCAQRSWSMKDIKEASSQAELDVVLRGRTLSEAEQNAAIRRSQVFRTQSMPANREVVFRPDWDHVKGRPEDANILNLCALEWTSRMVKDMQNVRCKCIDYSKVHFIAIPEMWASDRSPSPLHLHMMLWVEPDKLDWFDRRASRVWQQVLRRYGQRGRLHVDAIRDHKALSEYVQKQSDIDWVFEHTLTPLDLAKYRDSAQLA